MGDTNNKCLGLVRKAIRLRFSLRSMLALVALLAVVLSIWVISAKEQQRIVQRIRKLGGEVSYRHEKDSNDGWFGELLGADFLDTIEAVRLGDTPSSSRFVEEEPMESAIRSHLYSNLSTDLSKLRRLKTLNLYNIPLNEEDLFNLGALSELETLSLVSIPVSATGALQLRKLDKLSRLCLDYTSIDDRGISFLANLENLRNLRLIESRITDEGLDQLIKLKNLKQLYLNRTFITDEGILKLKVLSNLRYLELLECPHITYEGVAKLKESNANLNVSY